MRDIAGRFLHSEHNTELIPKDSSASELLEYVYNGGIWDADFRGKIDAVRKKPVNALSVDEIYTYLTAIACLDRTNEGLYYACIQDGTIGSLLERYLVLTADEQQKSSD